MGGLYLLLKHSNIPIIKKLLFFRNINPQVSIHFIKCNSDLIDITVPKNWDIILHEFECSHKEIFNHPKFLKFFSLLNF